MKNPKPTNSIEKLESSDHTFKACRGDGSNEGYPSPQSNDIWVEVSSIPYGTKNWDKLILPNHKFIRREPLSEEPVGNFGRRRYAKRPY